MSLRAPRGARLYLVGFLISLFVVGLTAAASAAPLDPTTIPKYEEPVIVPPAMPQAEKGPDYRGPRNYDYYEIAVRQFDQQVLPAGFPATTVWSYGAVNEPATFNFPAFTIEAEVGRGVRVKWINDLVDAEGNYLPHLLPVDPNLHWANPPGGPGGTDTMGAGTESYQGPVPIITHVHGAKTYEESDGYPEAWYLPNANNLPEGYATGGRLFEAFKADGELSTSVWEPGSAVFQYPNDQRATTLWYHDHSLGITRLNVYAGPAGFYLLRGGPDDVVRTADGGEAVLPGPAPGVGDDPFGHYYEVPLAIQDRSFNEDGSLYYPDNRAFFEGLTPEQLEIPFLPDEDSDIAPFWLPEFFPNTIVVNGRTWPYMEVQPKRYRLRLLNGSQSRFLILSLSEAAHIPQEYPEGATEDDLPDVELPMWQIGAEGGFLQEVVRQERLLLGPAERADVIVDFSGIEPGEEIIMVNTGPDDPFGGGEAFVDYTPADPSTTGHVMQFRVVAGDGSPDPSTPPEALVLPQLEDVGAADNVRHLSLNEEESGKIMVEVDGEGEYVLDPETGSVLPRDPGTYEPAEGNELVPFAPKAALLGTFDPETGQTNPLRWDAAVTENPVQGTVETWMMHNLTEDAHPIHIHLVQFQVVERRIESEHSPHYTGLEGGEIGDVLEPEPNERGFKDTVTAYPGEATLVKMRFDIAGLFVWHCHILEHEDNEMMRPYAVVAAADRAGGFSDVARDHAFALCNPDPLRSRRRCRLR
ncbi:MAG: multicopper oxidase domain-containing protein [Thermoleophilia bacterium]